ncbi:MAG: phosphoglucomutase/phosphomannomutase family protein [Candidatus Omnitrophota bacterium]
MSVIHFGTDGWRGTIAAEYTFENLRRVTQAVSGFLAKQYPRKGAVVIGYDRRFLSEAFAKASAEVLAGNGFGVLLFSNPVPTPLVSFKIVREKALGGIVLTASHNPPEFHGFKFKEASGASASSDTTRAIEALLGRSKVCSLSFEEGLRRKKIIYLSEERAYIPFLWRGFDRSLFKEARLHVLADSLYGSASGYLWRALEYGSVRAETLHTERDVLFGGFSPEPIPKNLGELMQEMRKRSYDLGVVVDGDGDRMAAVMPGGDFLPPSKILALLLYHLAAEKGLRGKVVKTVSGSMLIDRVADAYGLSVEESPIGFKHIAEKMARDPDFLIGGEESGGIGIRGHLPERDGILAILFLLEAMAIRKKSMTQLLCVLRNRFGSFETDRLDIAFPKEKWKTLSRRLRRKAKELLLGETPSEMKDLDGLKLLGTERWLMFRMSGTEPLLRIYAEGSSLQEVHRMLQKGKRLAVSELA